MIKLYLALVCFTLSIHAFPQIRFEKGYFIDNNGDKTECLIKNSDSKFNPTDFEYKLTEKDKPKSADIKAVKEFGIDNSSRFVRANVSIDRSSDNINELSIEREPDWSGEILFLKVLVDGHAVLYSYRDKFNTRFFYSIDGSSPEQFIYKRYIVNTIQFQAPQTQLKNNNTFQQQLWQNFRCEDIPQRDVEKMLYSLKQLEDYFRKYYQCKEDQFVEYKPIRKDNFNIKFKSGIVFSSLSVQDWIQGWFDLDFGNQISFTAGMELEFKMPFRNGKWAGILHPSFQYLPETTVMPGEVGGGRIIEMRYLECPVGIRHYSFLSDQLKFFVNGYIVPTLYASYNIRNFDYSGLNKDFSRPVFSYGLGLGYKKISFEYRYYGNPGLRQIDFKYSRHSFMLGYRL